LDDLRIRPPAFANDVGVVAMLAETVHRVLVQLGHTDEARRLAFRAFRSLEPVVLAGQAAVEGAKQGFEALELIVCHVILRSSSVVAASHYDTRGAPPLAIC
jgi:hypothetical protein